MLQIIRSEERGQADHGWLKARHTFSFADYHNPELMGFGPLRVINEDRVAPGKGFGIHPHRDMEIITYIIDGALQHKDSMGNGSVIRPGDVQRMTAGTGVRHSEFNASDDELVHLLQIWILPEQNSLAPGYEEKHFSKEERLNRWRLLASRDAREGSLTIHQDVDLYAAVLSSGQSLDHQFESNRQAFLQVVRGTIVIGDDELSDGDGAMLELENALGIVAASDTEMLLFDMG
jgi:redox-sensitive bicupin YhaK (pirin superfamily)